MDPITIAGLTIGLPQLIGWGISVSSIIISNVHTWIIERKRKKRDAARLLALQDQVTSTIETKLEAAAKELGQGAEKAAELQKAIQQSNDTLAREQLEKKMQALWKQQKEKEAQINSLMGRLESRDQALSEQQEQARQAQEKWLQAVKHMDHVTMPLEQLLGQRRAMRAKLLPLADMQPGCKPDDWHITTIVGPAGKGKSSFVRELLELHNYPNKLCEEVRVSAAGAGTLETMTYMLPKHNVLLLDCVGNAAAGHLARSEVLAADTVLIFMSDDARAEELHGDAFALAWRLRDYMHTVFVQPKADLWLQHNRSDKSPDDAIGALRYAVLAELRSKLSYPATQAQPGLRDRLAECQLSPAPEVAALLHLVDTMSMRAWVRATASDFWISVHCYYCMTNYVTGQPNQVTRIGVRDQAAEQALNVEAQAVRKAAMGALGSGGMPLSLLLRDSRMNSSSQSQEATAHSSSKCHLKVCGWLFSQED